MGASANLKALEKARRRGQEVRVQRSIKKAEAIDGFVVGPSPSWVLLHVVHDVQLLGWEAIRLDTVRAVERRRRSAFVNRVLAHRGQAPTSFDGADLASTRSVIASAARRFPLVGLMREERSVDTSVIGWPVDLTKKKVVLSLITPDATWDVGADTCLLADITRVAVGDDYHAALHELGGYPPIQ